jgi:hypothetical protein
MSGLIIYSMNSKILIMRSVSLLINLLIKNWEISDELTTEIYNLCGQIL